MMTTANLLHVSDLHIGRSAKEENRCRQVFDWMGIHYPGAPVLVTGDVTHSGTDRQCVRAQQLLTKLAHTNPVLPVPGNHDYGFLGLTFTQKSWKNWYRYLASPLGFPAQASQKWLNHNPDRFLGTLVSGGIAYFGLDSCDPNDKQLCAVGLISKKLADELAQELTRPKYRNLTRVVMLHHHPFKGSLLTALTGSKRLLKAVEGNCDALLFGHHHHCGVWWHDRKISLIVGSHKTTNRLLGDSLAVGVIEINKPAGKKAQFEYRLEAADLALADAA